VVNSNSENSLLPGINIGESLAADYPPAHVREANMTIEQPFRDGLYSVSAMSTRTAQSRPELPVQQRPVELRMGNDDRHAASDGDVCLGRDPAL